MIRLDAVTMSVRDNGGAWRGRRLVLDRASFAFAPGIWHVVAEPSGDARLLMHLLAGHHNPAGGAVRRGGARSWPLGQAAPFGLHLSGLDIVDALCSLYALERRGTFRLFRDLLGDPDWLALRFDRWPATLRRQFGHIAFIAPAFDIYLLDVSPVLPVTDFYRRWRALFLERALGKTVIIASSEHRAALRDFPGERVALSGGALQRAGAASTPLRRTMAAE